MTCWQSSIGCCWATAAGPSLHPGRKRELAAGERVGGHDPVLPVLDLDDDVRLAERGVGGLGRELAAGVVLDGDGARDAPPDDLLRGLGDGLVVLGVVRHLDRRRETELSWQFALGQRRLEDLLPEQVVRQHRHPDFLPHHLRRLATQHFNS